MTRIIVIIPSGSTKNFPLKSNSISSDTDQVGEVQEAGYFKSDSHLPKKIALFASLKALLK